MNITTKDIAQICGVSRSTVSRALNNEGRINPETKKKILKVAKEHGYRPDLLARGLVTGKTMHIGVVVFDVNNRYFAQMISAIEIEARKHGYFVNITLHQKDKDMEKELLKRLVDYHVDGIILSPVNKGDKYGEFLKGLNTPVVVIGNKVSEDIPYVGINEEKAAEEATQKLISSGYERIIFVCPPLADRSEENIYTHEQRKNGFKKAMLDYPNIISEEIGTWNYIDVIDDYLAIDNKKTAFFCSGDIFALNIIKHFRIKGKEVKKDYGIIGFDSIDMLDYMTPKLTTIYDSVDEVSLKAVNLLIDLMNDKIIENENLVDHKLIDGETI